MGLGKGTRSHLPFRLSLEPIVVTVNSPDLGLKRSRSGLETLSPLGPFGPVARTSPSSRPSILYSAQRAVCVPFLSSTPHIEERASAHLSPLYILQSQICVGEAITGVTDSARAHINGAILCPRIQPLPIPRPASQYPNVPKALPIMCAFRFWSWGPLGMGTS